MEYRFLGRTGLKVSVLGLGCNRLGWLGSGQTRADMVRLLECAVDAGVTFFDTADVYMAGESERLLGEVLGRRRREVVIATKVGSGRCLTGGLVARLHPLYRMVTRRSEWLRSTSKLARLALAGRRWSPGYVRQAVERSCRRLRADSLDLLQLHSPPATVMQQEDVLATLDDLIAAGAIRFYGASFGSSLDGRLPLQHGLSTLQVPISAVEDRAVRNVLGRAEAIGVGVIGNQPFRKGALFESGPSRPAPSTFDGTRPLAQTVLRATTQLGLSTVLVGTPSIAHLRENVAAVETPPLTPDEIRRLRTILSVGLVPG